MILHRPLAALLATVLSLASARAQKVEALFSDYSGTNPHTGLVQGRDGDFYGTTKNGGKFRWGTVFKISASGTYTLLHSFTFDDDNGYNPSGELVQGEDGDFYGTTLYGGKSYERGTVFKVSPTGAHTVLHRFNGIDGSKPQAGLVLGRDGAFYGTTIDGGISNGGSVFKITASGTLTRLHTFNQWTVHGQAPTARLVQGSDGDFYGTASSGGPHSRGTVFKITPTGTYTVLHSFNGTDGSNPQAGLVQGSDGGFYGTTTSGGAHNFGTVFKITASGTHIVLHSFNGNSGRNPQAELVQGGDGDFYGTSNEGGAHGQGTVFKITPTGTFTLLRSFNGANGSLPQAGLVLGNDASFFGTTTNGGAYDYGTVFRITAAGIYKVLHSFGSNNGSNPESGLIRGSDGDFYGTTTVGGAHHYGTVFKVTPTGTHTVLHSFNNTDGRNPKAGLVQGSDGDFYGTTYQGGVGKQVTLFKITASGNHTLLRSLIHSEGSVLFSKLVEGSDGDFYGTAQKGGLYDLGTVFKITASGTFTRIYSFDYKYGRWPYGGLVEGGDGDFYGTTTHNGTVSGPEGLGTFFKITASGTHTLLHTFDYFTGYGPDAEIIKGSDGNFYGTTKRNESNSGGTIFKITASGTHTLLHRFNKTDGSSPSGGLVEGGDGAFYGTTSKGGLFDRGTVFKITSTGTHTLLHSFDGSIAVSPLGPPAFGSDGNLYGTAIPMVVWRMNFDTTTQPPTLITPNSDGATTSPIAVSFTLPEAALPGSVKLAFGATELTLGSGVESAGTHSFSFDPAHPTANSEIASGGPVADGTYTVTLSYQDFYGNPLVSVLSTSVTVDSAGPLGGTVVLSPSSAVAPSTLMTVDLAGWTDERLPLSYALLVDDVVVSAASPGSTRNFTAPAFAGAFTLKARIADSLGNTTTVLRSFHTGISPQQGYDNATTAAGLTGPDALPGAVLYQGDLTNLLKYAFNLNLTTPDRRTLTPGSGMAGLPVITRPAPGIMRLEYVRRIGSGLVYTPQKRAALEGGTWVPLTALPVVTPIDTNWERVHHDEPFNPATTDGMFGRVEVTLP